MSLMSSRRSRQMIAITGVAMIVSTVACEPQAGFATRTSALGSSTLVISQIYGGGGNSGATYKNDFIEVFNRGSAAVNVSAWSVQYA